MKNQGKIFEEDFRKSLPLDDSNLFYYRFKDSPASFGNINQQNQFIRFTNNNMCDNMIFYKGKLFLCELKSHKGKSLPLSCIREKQLIELSGTIYKKNVYPMLIIFFSEIGECYALNIASVNQFLDISTSKSIPLLFCKEKGFKIDCRKKLTHYVFEVVDFLDNFIENKKREV